MSTITATALSGVNAAVRRFETAARSIAGAPLAANPSGAQADLTEDVVGLIAAGHDFSANLQVLRTADEMTGALLDLRI